jgi:hypothetical protein
MLRKLRPRRPGHATVVAYLALFVALGGTGAYAANTVFSSDIVDGEVKSVDVGDNEIKSADVKDQSLTTFDVSTFLGVDVVDNTLTGADVDESTLKLGSEPWKEVGVDFPWWHLNEDFNCHYRNYDPANFDSAGISRDAAGFVHFKGLIKAVDGTGFLCSPSGNVHFFDLPAGYWPAKRQVLVTLSNNKLARVGVNAAGQVFLDFPTDNNFTDAQQWISLDGLSFRCAPSGQDGCP